MKIQLSFQGRELGAIGIMHKITKTIEVLPQDEDKMRSIVERFNLQKEELRNRKRTIDDPLILAELRQIPHIVDELYKTHEHIFFGGGNGDIVELLD